MLKPYLAIILQTMRSALRSKVFHVLAVLILLAVVLLPLTVEGDGTAISLVQISVTFSLGVVVALISTTALWLSCSQLSTEIERYSIHLVVAKPCPKPLIWLGKWTGIFLMHAAILIVSAAVIFALIQLRVSLGGFSKGELRQLDAEVRVGRTAFPPNPRDYTAQISAEYEKRKGENLPEDALKAEIRRQLVARDGEIRAGAVKEWTFSGLKPQQDDIFLRFRLFSGSTTSTDQQMMYFTWKVKDPTSPAADPFVELYPEGKGDDQKFHSAKGGSFHEWHVSGKYIDPTTRTVTLRFYNMNHQVENFDATFRSQAPDNETPEQKLQREKEDQEKADRAKIAILQQADGPLLLVAEASFAANYVMAIVQALLQIAFLAALGCAVSAAFSTPVAAFVAVSYLVIGLTVQAAIDAPLLNDDGSYKYNSALDHGAHLLARAVDVVVVSVDDFDATASLANGRLVTNRRIAKVMRTMERSFDTPAVAVTLGTAVLLIRWVLIFGLGIWIFQKRELGSVIRK